MSTPLITSSVDIGSGGRVSILCSSPVGVTTTSGLNSMDVTPVSSDVKVIGRFEKSLPPGLVSVHVQVVVGGSISCSSFPIDCTKYTT